MARLLKNILDGMQQVLVLWPDVDYVRPSKRGFRSDVELLRQDAERVSRGLRKVALENGKIYHR